MAATLDDIYLRRTMLGLRGDLGLPTLETITELARTQLGWTSQRAEAQAAGYRDAVRRRYRPGVLPARGEVPQPFSI